MLTFKKTNGDEIDVNPSAIVAVGHRPVTDAEKPAAEGGKSDADCCVLTVAHIGSFPICGKRTDVTDQVKAALGL